MQVRLLFFALFTLLFACQKNDSGEEPNNPFTKIADKKWQIVSSISIDSSKMETDLYNEQEDYKKDDYFIFNSDSTYELNDNILLRFDSTAKILDAGHWELSTDRQYLLRKSDMYPTEYFPAHIVLLTADSLRTETSFPADNSIILTGFKRIPRALTAILSTDHLTDSKYTHRNREYSSANSGVNAPKCVYLLTILHHEKADSARIGGGCRYCHRSVYHQATP